MKRNSAFKRAVCILCCILFCVSVSAGCGGTDTSVVQEEQNTVVFTDSLGREVEVPEHITRVVSSGSLAQIFLFAVAPDALIGVSGAWSKDAADYVDEKYLELPEVGAFFGGHDLNYEEIVALNPQVIVDVGEAKTNLESDMEEITEKTGIPVVHIEANVDTMGQAFEALGNLLGEKEQGTALKEYCDGAYENTLETMKQVEAAGAKKSLLYSTGENGLNVVAQNSYHSQIIDLISDNRAIVKNPSAKGSGNEVDMEQILNWDPEVIIFAPDGYYDYVSEDETWKNLQAVRNGNYYEVPNGPYNWMGFPPSCNRILGMIWLTSLLYPEYVNYDLEEEVKEYYQLFYHQELTGEQYDALTAHAR